MMNYNDGFVFNKDMEIKIISSTDTPVKIVFESQPCPMMWKRFDHIYRCPHAKSRTEEDLSWILYCGAEKCDRVSFDGKVGVVTDIT